MKANRLLFDKLRQQWDILKMKSAYILAEREIIAEANEGNDLTGFDTQPIVWTTASTTPEHFHFEVDRFGNMKNLSEAEIILDKAKEVREKLDKAIEEEDYVKAKMLQVVLDGLEKKYNRLK